MKKLTFAVAGAACLALAACGSQQDDALENVEQNLQADEMNALADNAAMDAQTEAEALENQANELDAENAVEDEVDDNPTDPAEVEEDVQGM